MMRHESVQQCQLSDAEVRGFIAEAVLNEDNEIAYIDHIKTWVPIIFELRKSKVYESVTAKDWGLDAAHLVDLSGYEAAFPLMTREMMAEMWARRQSKRGDSSEPGSRRVSRRGSRADNDSRKSDLGSLARMSKGLSRASQRFMAAGKKGSQGGERELRGRGSFRSRAGSNASSASEHGSRRGSRFNSQAGSDKDD